MKSRVTRLARATIVAVVVALASTAAQAAEIRVAAASDLQFALREIAQEYQKRSGNTIALTFGSSGALATQIQNGAPFDVFFSADASYPEKLADGGFADKTTLVRYARGVLVLWVANSVPKPSAPIPMEPRNTPILAQPEIKRIAIANPQHAPYGRAAVEALKKTGMYEKVSAKFIMGENVSQAAQFAESGNAEAALLPLSLAMQSSLSSKGHYTEIGRSLYEPIVQVAVVTKRAADPSASRDFLRFAVTLGIPILRKYGFEAQELNPPHAPGAVQ